LIILKKKKKKKQTEKNVILTHLVVETRGYFQSFRDKF
jgi:hypothetical protein